MTSTGFFFFSIYDVGTKQHIAFMSMGRPPTFLQFHWDMCYTNYILLNHVYQMAGFAADCAH